MRLPNFIRKMRAPERSPKDTPQAGAVVMKGSRVSTTPYSRMMAAEAALRHPIAFRCLTKIAEAVQSVAWEAVADPAVPASARAKATELEALNRLLASPHDLIPAGQMRYWMALAFATMQRVSVMISFGTNNFPNGIYPLDAAKLTAKTNDRGLISSYEYGTNGSKYPTRRAAKPGESFVGEITRPNLTGSVEDTARPSPLGAIGVPAEISSLLLSRALDTASGQPNVSYLVTSDRPLTSTQQDEIQKLLDTSRPGGDEGGSVLLIHGATVTIQKLETGLEDLHTKVPLDDMARMIAGAWGVPIPLLGLGAADSAKFASNYQEARRAFWEETIIPGYLVPLEDGLTDMLCGPGARIVFDRDSIEALASIRVARARQLAGVDYLTDDEKRSLAGFSPMTDADRAEIARRRAAGTVTAPAPIPAAPSA